MGGAGRSNSGVCVGKRPCVCACCMDVCVPPHCPEFAPTATVLLLLGLGVALLAAGLLWRQSRRLGRQLSGSSPMRSLGGEGGGGQVGVGGAATGRGWGWNVKKRLRAGKVCMVYSVARFALRGQCERQKTKTKETRCIETRFIEGCLFVCFDVVMSQLRFTGRSPPFFSVLGVKIHALSFHSVLSRLSSSSVV